jgi:shikimate dehydrogenase
MKACVLGAPLAHTLSPRLHRYWLRRYGIEGLYEVYETQPDALMDRLSALADQGFAGCNLTLPLKEHALDLMDS